jgi:ketosteroid isomerase-like protein
MPTEEVMTSLQSEITALFSSRSEAIRAKDIDRLMPLYSPDVVYFDLVPPLEYSGAAALRARFVNWFEGWKSAIRQDIDELTILASGDVAAAHMLIHAGGTRKDGSEVAFWVRASNCCRRADRGWLITHEHISLPVDLRTGTAVTDLVPP